jgi:pyrroline-5-carboxylate reductase
MPVKQKSYAVAFLGAGNMATALVRGFAAAKLFKPAQMIATDSESAKRQAAKRRLKIAATADNGEAVRSAKIVVLAVKPQVIDAVLDGVCPAVTAKHLFVSIAAGVTTARLESHLGPLARVIRVMPNTPALLGRGMSVVVRGARATAADERLALRLFRSVGAAVAVQDEEALDAVTGLSGSGPAYVYLFAEALIRGGIEVGLTPALSRQLALQTVLGAAHMLTEAGETPEALRAAVTSPNGTTFAGLTEMQRRQFEPAVVAAVAAATARSRELGRA